MWREDGLDDGFSILCLFTSVSVSHKRTDICPVNKQLCLLMLCNVAYMCFIISISCCLHLVVWLFWWCLFPWFFLFFNICVDEPLARVCVCVFFSSFLSFFFLFYERVPAVLQKWCCLDNILCRLIPPSYGSTSGEPAQGTQANVET